MSRLAKKIFLIVMTVLLLTSCAGKKKEEKIIDDHDGVYYLEQLKNYKVRDKNPENTVDDPEFAEFEQLVFKEAFENDFLSMHFSVVDYRKYNINKPEVGLGDIKYGPDQDSIDYFNEQLEKLHSFDYSKLSYNQQYDYDALEYSDYETLALTSYYQFSFPLSVASNILEDIISNYTDYPFYDQESVDDYITCINDTMRFCDDLLVYLEDQANDGYPICDEWIDYTQDTVVNRFLNKTEDNDLITSFEKRIDELDFLDEAAKAKYKEENRKAVIDVILPAYKKVGEGIEKYRGRAKAEDYTLYKLNKNYAEIRYIVGSSSNEGVDSLFQLIKDSMAEFEAEFVSCYYDAASWQDAMDAIDGVKYKEYLLERRECIDYLSNNLSEYFPVLDSYTYDVEILDPDVAPEGAIAYYYPSPVDNVDQNIIRINPNAHLSYQYQMYSTQSHEGVPGHMYQHNYFLRAGGNEMRKALSFIGYTEGWAMYASYYALRFAGLDDYAASVLYYNAWSYFTEYSFMDMAVNYYGMSPKEVYDYLKDESMLVYSESYVESICKYVQENPLTFIYYGTGIANFFKLRDKAMKALGDKFSYPAFADAVLKNGPLPFNILEQAVDAYIAAQ